MASSIEVNTEEYSCESQGDLAIIRMGPQAFRIATDLKSKEHFVQLLAAIEESDSIRGIALFNTQDYPGDESYREFLESVMHGKGRSARGAGILAGRYGNALSQLALRVSEFSKPLVAGLSGCVSGEDLGMLLPCDFRFATPDVTVTFPNVALGFPPSGVLVHYLLHMVGPARASEILYSTSPLEAKDALAMGILNRIVSEGELEKCSMDQLARLAKLPAGAFAATRLMIQPDPLELHRYLNRSLEMRWLALRSMNVVD
jgi:enoyl-CoA hydratase/carnithine racemase